MTAIAGGVGLSNDSHRLFVFNYLTTRHLLIMSTDEEYDKLKPEEREARDKLDRAREAEEQAGMN